MLENILLEAHSTTHAMTQLGHQSANLWRDRARLECSEGCECISKSSRQLARLGPLRCVWPHCCKGKFSEGGIDLL